MSGNKFIKNPPTVSDLKHLYESKVYQDLLNEYDKRARYKSDTRQEDQMRVIHTLTNTRKRYLILNIPFEEVQSGFEQKKEELLNYCIYRINFFNDMDDGHPDGDFPEGEEPNEEEKSVVIERFGISRFFFLDCFCEFYLLNIGDKERLLHFLKATRMPQAKKFIAQITKLYKQAMKKD